MRLILGYAISRVRIRRVFLLANALATYSAIILSAYFAISLFHLLTTLQVLQAYCRVSGRVVGIGAWGIRRYEKGENVRVYPIGCFSLVASHKLHSVDCIP